MGLAGNVYAFDLRIQGGVLVGDLDEVQPSGEAVGEVVNLRWDTISNSCSLLDDVAYVELPAGYEKLPRQYHVPLGSSGDGEIYFWDHTLRGFASAIILVLPREWTLSRTGKGRTTSPLDSHCPPLPPIFPPLIRGDSRRSLRSPSQSGYRWCRRFQGQLYQ